jgi:hypothetical protein
MNLATLSKNALPIPQIQALNEQTALPPFYPHAAGRHSELSTITNGKGAAEVIVDAASVDVSIHRGVLVVIPARHVTCLSLSIEQCSDGSLLLSDELGYAGTGAIPELRGEIHEIHITLGIDGDDTLHLDLPSKGPLAKNIRIFTAFGDEVTRSYGPIVIQRANKI